MGADLPADQESPGSRPDEQRRYRLHPRTAWTAHRQDLGDQPTPLFHDDEAVVAVRLPEGWPLVFHGAPALIWQELACAGEEGRTIDALAGPWEVGGPKDASVRAELTALVHRWVELGLLNPA